MNLANQLQVVLEAPDGLAEREVVEGEVMDSVLPPRSLQSLRCSAEHGRSL
jgi:hypothetical protein